MHDVEAKTERTFQAGLEMAQDEWCSALQEGMSDPVVLLSRIDSEDGTQIEVSCAERTEAIQWLETFSGEAAKELRRRNTPGLPMSVLVEFGGAISIFDSVDPRVPVEQQ